MPFELSKRVALTQVSRQGVPSYKSGPTVMRLQIAYATVTIHSLCNEHLTCKSRDKSQLMRWLRWVFYQPFFHLRTADVLQK